MNYVNVDFTDAFCPLGCCRPIAACLDHWIVELAPKCLVITGLRAEEETKFGFRGLWNRRKYTMDDLKVQYGLQFERDADKVMDEWKV
jgi:hypothetical protein